MHVLQVGDAVVARSVEGNAANVLDHALAARAGRPTQAILRARQLGLLSVSPARE